MPIACLPWYAMPETDPAQDALWAVIARHLRRAGIDAPMRISRGVPIPRIFTDPELLLAQCCGYDIVYGFAASLIPLATPCYAAPGCDGPTYRSFVLVRDDSPAKDLAALEGATVAVNGFNSHSGTNALRALVAPLSEDGRFFGAVRVSGAHAASLALLLAGEADVMAMDCVLHALLTAHRPGALAGTRTLAITDAAPAPPLVTSATAGKERVDRIRDGLLAAIADPTSAEPRAVLLLDRLALLPVTAYQCIAEIEAMAARRGYFELHATTPIIVKG
jgi:ABC-type phosphate/phosphonate transport system substrate-binding protein